jgi:hypothetical protein
MSRRRISQGGNRRILLLALLLVILPTSICHQALGIGSIRLSDGTLIPATTNSTNTTCDYPGIFGSYQTTCIPVTHEGRLVGTSGPPICYKETCEAEIGR